MKRLTILLSTIFALASLPSGAEVKQLMMIFTDTAGVQQMVPVQDIESVTFDNDVIEEVKDGHAVVDLGLSVNWAYSNLDLDGSNLESAPYMHTYALYGWADPTGKKRSTDPFDYPSKEESGSSFAPETIVGTKFDIAHVNWGGDWRLPSDAEMKELVEKCDWVYETVNSTTGYRITGPNGNSIFLAANGWRYGEELGAKGTYGGYWSGTVSKDDMNAARCVAFNPLTHNTGYTNRNYGLSVRPVVNKSIFGDVNNDGAVDVSDVTALINEILGSVDYPVDRCDINGDGIVNVSDATALINLILK